MQFLCLHYIHNDHDDIFTSRFERKKNIKKQRKQKMSSYIKKKKCWHKGSYHAFIVNSIHRAGIIGLHRVVSVCMHVQYVFFQVPFVLELHWCVSNVQLWQRVTNNPPNSFKTWLNRWHEYVGFRPVFPQTGDRDPKWLDLDFIWLATRVRIFFNHMENIYKSLIAEVTL